MSTQDSLGIEQSLLARLSNAAGPPGAEGEVRDIVHEVCRPLGSLQHDAHGSVICELPGDSDGPRVALDAHMDEVGFMVQSIGPEGRLAFLPLGGWWGHVLLGQRVTVLGSKGKVPGVVASKPPHFLSPGERQKVLSLENMNIDLGASTAEEVAELGVSVADPIVPDASFQEMHVPNILSGKAFDDRAGVGVLLESLRLLAQRPTANTVVGVAAVQEEVGCRGAGTAAHLARPDVGIILEGTPADDMPGARERQAILGQGPQIRFYDPTAISNRRLVDFVKQTAADIKVPVQIAVRRSGGTDAKTVHVHGGGVPTVVLGVPCRYIHTHVALLNLLDYVNTIRLVVATVERLDASVAKSFVTY